MTVGVVMCLPQVSLLCLACGGLYYDRASVYVWIRFWQLVDCYWIIWREIVPELVDIVIHIHFVAPPFPLYFICFCRICQISRRYLFFFFFF